MVTLVATLFLTTIVDLAPIVVWEKEVGEVHRIEARGNDLLLTTPNGYEVRDAASGKSLGTTDNAYQARLSSDRLLVVRGTYFEPGAIEAWQLRPFRLEWRFETAERSGVGEIVGNSLYYGTQTSILRMSIPDFHVLDRRDLPYFEAPIQPMVFGERVYFNYYGHEVYGLRAEDLSVGWRNFSDCAPAVVDEFGCVATARLNWWLAIIGIDGKSPDLERVANGGYTFSRNLPAVSTTQVITSGSAYVFGRGRDKDENAYTVRVLSPYLLAFNRKDGSLDWKIPMIAAYPVLIGDRILVFGANSPNGEKEWKLQLRAAKDGKLLWQSDRVALEPEWSLTTNGEYVFEYTGAKLRALKLSGR